MTTPAENLQKAYAVSFANFNLLTAAWTKAVSDMYGVVLEWAEEEQVYVRDGQTKVFMTVDEPTEVRAELHDVRDPDKTLLPPSAVVVSPNPVEPREDGQATVVVVTVTMFPVSAPAYIGSLVDTKGNVVEPDVYVSMMTG